MIAIFNKFLSNIVDIGFRILGIEWLQKLCIVQINPQKSIILSVKYLLPFLEYFVVIVALSHNILERFERFLH